MDEIFHGILSMKTGILSGGTMDRLPAGAATVTG
jgi:hypothetical protein